MIAPQRVLSRGEAQQMATDLGTAIGNLIGLAAEMTEVDKVFALDTLILLRTKQSILEGEIMWTDREAAEQESAQSPRQSVVPVRLVPQEGGAS